MCMYTYIYTSYKHHTVIHTWGGGGLHFPKTLKLH